MRRHFFNALTALSLLLFVAVAALWADSYIEIVEVRYAPRGDDQMYVIRSYWGALRLDYSDPPTSAASAPYFKSHWASVRSDARQYLRPEFRGFGRDRRTGALLVPHWAPLAASAVLPVLWLRSRLALRRRRRMNLCPLCGYDPRASPGRCPECGAEPGAVAVKGAA